jgi:hypothetical protein
VGSAVARAALGQASSEYFGKSCVGSTVARAALGQASSGYFGFSANCYSIIAICHPGLVQQVNKWPQWHWTRFHSSQKWRTLSSQTPRPLVRKRALPVDPLHMVGEF